MDDETRSPGLGSTTEEDQAPSYYQRHRGTIQKRRHQRYHEDSEYRETVREQSREYQRKRRATERTKNPVRRGPNEPSDFTIDVGGKDVLVHMYTTGMLAAALGRKAQTMRVWEKKGIIPPALYRSPQGARLYTEFQSIRIVNIFQEEFRSHGDLAFTRITKTEFPRRVKELWRDFPLGIDPEGV